MRYSDLALRQQAMVMLGALCMAMLSPAAVTQESQASLPVVAELHVPDTVTAGDSFRIEASITIIEYNQTRIRLHDENGRRLPDTYPDKHFVRIIAPANAQDAAVLAGYETENPMAASASVRMSLQLEAPDEVVSGEDWTIRATVTNHGTETMTVDSTLVSLGALGPRYRSVSCRPGERCENPGPIDIAAGETATLGIVMLPASRIIQPGIWKADSPALRVRDSLGREALLYAGPLRVAVTSESHLPMLVPDYESIRGL